MSKDTKSLSSYYCKTSRFLRNEYESIEMKGSKGKHYFWINKTLALIWKIIFVTLTIGEICSINKSLTLGHIDAMLKSSFTKVGVKKWYYYSQFTQTKPKGNEFHPILQKYANDIAFTISICFEYRGDFITIILHLKNILLNFISLGNMSTQNKGKKKYEHFQMLQMSHHNVYLTFVYIFKY